MVWSWKGRILGGRRCRGLGVWGPRLKIHKTSGLGSILLLYIYIYIYMGFILGLYRSYIGIMEKENGNYYNRLYWDYRVYIGAIWGKWKREWKLL